MRFLGHELSVPFIISDFSHYIEDFEPTYGVGRNDDTIEDYPVEDEVRSVGLGDIHFISLPTQKGRL